jgi:hypothetical protein
MVDIQFGSVGDPLEGRRFAMAWNLSLTVLFFCAMLKKDFVSRKAAGHFA